MGIAKGIYFLIRKIASGALLFAIIFVSIHFCLIDIRWCQKDCFWYYLQRNNCFQI